jgi:uncharacterized protein (TIGR03437 family)
MNFSFKLIWQKRASSFQRAALILTVLLGVTSLWLFPTHDSPVEHSTASSRLPITRASAAERLGQLPLAFAASGDQEFTARGQRFTLCLAENVAVLVKPSASSNLKSNISSLKAQSVRLHWLNANPHPALEGLSPLPGKVNYFIGNNPRQWQTDLPTFARVRYRQLYAGIDLIFYGGAEDQQQLEYDFVIAPHADPQQIKLVFSGADKLELADNGDLLLHIAGETLRQRRPVAYQMTAHGRAEVTANYFINDGQISFRLGAYNHELPLVIDPLIVYSSYLGGNNTDIAQGIAVDREGNIYLTGQTFSPNFPVRAPFDTMLDGANDAFVMKLDSTGRRVLFSTYIGGRSSNDRGLGIAVDNGENVYFVGETASLNFPTVNAAQSSARGNGDAFAVKLNTSGNTLLYSTYLGGGFSDVAYAVALDRFDNAYITGRTDSTNFPVKNPIQATLRGQRDVFATLLDPDGVLLAQTFLGGTPATSGGGRDDEAGFGIAVDRLQNAYITGATTSADFPNLNAAQRNFAGVEDAFVAKLDLRAAKLIYATFLGGTRVDGARGIALDGFGNAYVTGYTLSADFPVQNALQPNYASGSDAFVTKLNANGSAIVYSTFLGGNEEENTGLISEPIPIGSIFVDSLGYAYITGKTGSANFPVVRALQAERRGDDDAFLAKLDPAGSSLVFSTYFGTSFTGNNGFEERGLGLALDTGGAIFVTGQILGGNMFTTLPLQTSYGGGLSDAFILKVTTPDIINVAPVSAASFNGAQLAPEGIVALFGSGLATGFATADTLPLPTTLEGTSVKVTDKSGTERLAPLFFVSPNQINLQIPPATTSGAATITVNRPEGAPISAVVQIEAVAPALFTANPTGQGVAAAVALRIKADGAQSFEPVAQFDPVSQRFVALPLDLGAEGDQVFLILFGTGLRNRSALEAVTVRIGGVNVEAGYVGAQGGLVGFDQVNLPVPRGLAGRGEVTIEMMVEGLMVNPVSINVR